MSDDGFDALTAAIESVGAPPAEPETTPETPAEPEAPPEPEGEPAKADLFSAEALKTPEGLKAARTELDRLKAEADKTQRKLDKADIKFKKRDRDWERKRDEENAKLAEDRATARALRAQLGLLKTGSATQILEVIGTLTGKPGRKVWEELAAAALRDGKAPAESPVIDELREQIKELKAHLAGKAKADEEGRKADTENFKARRRGEIIQAATDATKYPELAGYSKLGRGAEIYSYVLEMKRASCVDEDGELIPGARPLDDAECLSRIESQIRSIKSGQPMAGSRPDEGQGPSPGDAQSRSGPQSISPANTRSRSSAREMTDKERMEELRRNPDYVMSLFR